MIKSTNPLAKWEKTLKVDENGCHVCDNVHNHDGYVRVRCSQRKRLVMLHVKKWEEEYGAKPEGMELNHKCLNRGCCNIEHLELIDGSAHATLTNVNRVGYIMERKSDDQIADFYERVKYKGESINSVCRKEGIKRSTLSSIMNKRSRTELTDTVDKKYSDIN